LRLQTYLMRNKLFSKLDEPFWVKVIYVFLYAGAGCYLSFYNLYLDQQNFTGFQIGAINGIYQAILVFAVIFWGIQADRVGIRKILLFTFPAVALLVIGLQYINQFQWLVLYIFIFAFIYHPNPPLTDSLAISMALKKQKGDFGKYRLWGSFGWGVATLLMGLILKYFSLISIFWMAALFFMISWLILWSGLQKEVKTVAPARINLKNFKDLFGRPALAFFFVLLLLYGIAVAPLNYFINLYYLEIGASNSLIGVAFTVQAFFEIPFFLYGNELVVRFGPKKIIAFTLLVTIARLVAYGLIDDPLWAIPFGLGHAFTLALFLVAVVEYVHRLVPAHWRATAQSMIWGFHFGAGITLGNLLIGALKDTYTMQGVMLINAGLAVLVTLMILLYFARTRRKTRAR